MGQREAVIALAWLDGLARNRDMADFVVRVAAGFAYAAGSAGSRSSAELAAMIGQPVAEVWTALDDLEAWGALIGVGEPDEGRRYTLRDPATGRTWAMPAESGQPLDVADANVIGAAISGGFGADWLLRLVASPDIPERAVRVAAVLSAKMERPTVWRIDDIAAATHDGAGSVWGALAEMQRAGFLAVFPLDDGQQRLEPRLPPA